MNDSTRTFTASDAQDALAVALEQSHVSLDDLRRYRASQTREAKPLDGDALEQACRGVLTLALAKLTASGATDEAAQSLLSPLIDAPPASTLAGQAIDLSTRMGNVPEPEFLPSERLGEKLLYEGVSALVAGHKKSGKSLVMTVQAVDLLNVGRHVVYLDQENGEDIFAERLQALRANKTAVAERFHYVPFPKLPPLDQFRGELERIANQWPDSWVVIDSLRTLMAYYKLDPNKDTDVEQFLGKVMGAVKSADCAPLTVMTIDHSNRTTKDGDEFAAAGSFAKPASVDTVYYFEKLERFSVYDEGTVKLRTVDDRRGRLDEVRHYTIGGQGKGNALHFAQADSDEIGAMRRMRAGVETFLVDHAGERFPKSTVAKNVTGDDAAVYRALELAVAANPRTLHKEPNPKYKGAWLYYAEDSGDSESAATEGIQCL